MQYSLRKLFVAVLSLFIIASCSSSENTIVIEDAPTSSARTDTTEQDPEPLGPFTQLTIGENQDIHTLDPLFVQNDAGRRALQLVYEGLVRFNENGDIEPAIADNWSVSNNGRTYRFALNTDLFYHDSNIFSNGRGRRLVAADVKKVFERMAKATVPDHAAQLFMDISGFEPYYREQHQVMMASERQLNGVSGIRAPNDSTVVFSLVESDEQFLNKLASPYALIYPQESIKADNFIPVGTGPFTFSQKRSDSLYIFSRFDNYRISNQPKINRVDVRTSNSESVLLNLLQSGEIQLIPALGPKQMAAVLNGNGQLKRTMEESYQLFEKGMLQYFVRYHEGADTPKGEVVHALNRVQTDTLFHLVPENAYEINWSLPQSSSSSAPDSISAVYSSDPFVNRFYSQLGKQLQENGISFSVSLSRVPTRHTSLRTGTYFPIQNTQMASNSALATLSLQSLAVAENNLNNLAFNDFPWWIDLREVTLSSTASR